MAGLVLGCAWTVYTNVLGASIYPSVNSAALEAPAVKRTAAVATRPATPAFNDVFASLSAAPPAISAPETVPSSIMFNEEVRSVGAARSGAESGRSDQTG